MNQQIKAEKSDRADYNFLLKLRTGLRQGLQQEPDNLLATQMLKKVNQLIWAIENGNQA